MHRELSNPELENHAQGGLKPANQGLIDLLAPLFAPIRRARFSACLVGLAVGAKRC